MTDKKLTDNEIVKALECCGNQLDCVGCECVENCPQDINELNGLALDLINRQQAENERLCAEVDELIISKDLLFDEAEALIKTAKSEAYKEFAEWIYSLFPTENSEIVVISRTGIAKKVNELVGDDI